MTRTPDVHQPPQPEVYRKITHAERVAIIYKHMVHRIPMRKIARRSGVSYNSIRNIMDTYRNTGRTNKKNYKTILLQNFKESPKLAKTALHLIQK